MGTREMQGLHNRMNLLNATELFTLKWLVLHYVKFTSKNKPKNQSSVAPKISDDRVASGALTSWATCVFPGDFERERYLGRLSWTCYQGQSPPGNHGLLGGVTSQTT